MRISNPKDMGGNKLLHRVNVAAGGVIQGDGTEANPLTANKEALASTVFPDFSGNSGKVLRVNANETGTEWAAMQSGGSSSTPEISSLKVVRTISSENAFEALAQEVKESVKDIAFLATPGTTNTGWSAQNGYVVPGHAYLLVPFHLEYSYEVQWKHFVVTSRHWKCTLKGGSCKVNGVLKTLSPGKGEEAYSTDTYGTSWNATKPAETTILRLALDLKILYISDTEKIQLNTNGTLDSDGNLIVKGDHMEIVDGLWKYTGKAVTELAYDYDIDYHTSGHWEDSSTVTVDIRDYFLFDLTLFYTSCAVPTLTQAEALEIKPGQRYEWTLNTNSTLNAATVSAGLWASAQIDIAPGAHTVTAGNNLTIVDALTTDAVNICEARWRNGSARLKVVDVIAEGSGGGTTEGTITTSSQTITGTAGTSLSYNLANYVTVSNGQTPTFALASGQSLPEGLSLLSSGVISGTPVAAVTSSTVKIKVSASNCPDVEMTVTFNIAESIQQGTITVKTNPTIQGVVNTALSPYNLASCVTVSNGQTPSFRWNDVYSPKPSWLTLTTPGVLSGTPTSIPSPTTGEVLVSANKCSNEPNINITWDIIAAGAITVSDQTIKGTVGKALSPFNLYDLTDVSNSQTPTFAVKSGTLPTGIDLSPEGVFTGTPTATSSATVVIQIAARGCPTKDVNITFDIKEAQAGSDDFPVSFTVTESHGLNGQSCLGTYTRTGNTLALDGVNYPVYSFTNASGKVHYIHISKWVYEGQQVLGTSWVLDTRTSFTAESPIRVQEVYGTSRLEAGTYKPSSTYWNGDMGAVVVSCEMGNAGTPALTAKAFGHPGTTVANMYKAALQTYTYTDTFQVKDETFPYYTGGGATPWYLFGGKARLNGTSATVYAVYLSSQNPSTMNFNEWQLTFCRVDLDSSARLILLGETDTGLTYEGISSKLQVSTLSSGAWWRVADSDYPQSERADTITWEGETSGGGASGDSPQYVYTVTGLTGSNATANGNYYANGETHDGYPVYTNGTYFMYYIKGIPMWAIYTEVAEAPGNIYKFGEADNPVGSWDPPGTVVSAYSGSSSGGGSGAQRSVGVVGTDGLPQSTSWSSASSSATVSWS